MARRSDDKAQSASKSRPVLDERRHAREISAAFEAGFSRAAAEAFKCLALCYNLEISLKDVKIDVLDITGSSIPGLKTIAEQLIKALVDSKFATKTYKQECKDGCDCLRLFEGETDWTLPSLEKKKTFSKTIPIAGKITFSVHFTIKVTLHVKGQVGVCIDEVV